MVALPEWVIPSPGATLADIKAWWDSVSERQHKQHGPKPSAVLIEELPKFRNMMAHPQRFNLVMPPHSPLAAFELLGRHRVPVMATTFGRRRAALDAL